MFLMQKTTFEADGGGGGGGGSNVAGPGQDAQMNLMAAKGGNTQPGNSAWIGGSGSASTISAATAGVTPASFAVRWRRRWQ